jgi:NitT/TauT family transport system permease protein
MSMITFDREERELVRQEHPATTSIASTRMRARARRRQRERLLTMLPPLVLGVCLLISWYISTASGALPSYKLPGLADVWNALSTGLSSGLFQSNAGVTLQESLGGFLLAFVLALPIGYGLTKWRWFAATMQPYLAAGQAVPAIVIAPFLVMWLGYGLSSLVVLCMLVVVFPMIITIALGFQTIDSSLIDAARVEGASFWPLLVHLEIPLAMPAIMAAVRTGLTLSIVGALVGEFVLGGDQGLGSLLEIAKSQYNMPLMFATVIILALIAAILYGCARGLTRLSEVLFS